VLPPPPPLLLLLLLLLLRSSSSKRPPQVVVDHPDLGGGLQQPVTALQPGLHWCSTVLAGQ